MSYTPAMQQYIDMKKQYSDCILFFRIGDFYETFFDDAKLCSKLLDIVLTSKHKDTENPIPLAGIPYHSVDKYIPKLIHHGYKIAIAEQTTDPAPGKIVERQVVSVITPGTYIQESKKDFTYMAAVTFSPHKDTLHYHLARGDFGIGQYRSKSFKNIEELQKFLVSIRPVEIVFDLDFPSRELVTTFLQQQFSCLISVYDIPVDPALYISNLTNIQHVSSFGKALEDGRLWVMALLFHYLNHTQKSALKNISRISFHTQDKRVLLDDITIKNLELFSSSYEWSEKYSLFWILDTTRTQWWSRLLRYILANPSQDLEEINMRLGHIASYQTRLEQTKHIHATLHHVSDIPKLISTILYRKCSASLMVKLRATLRIFFQEHALLDELHRIGFSQEYSWEVQHLYNYLEQLIKDDTEYHDDINFVRDGYDPSIDDLRTIAFHSDELLLSYQQTLAQITGVHNVKLKFVMNQGYFIEITNKDIELFEQKLAKANGEDKEKLSLMRRNTLKWGQRYTSPYLDELQEKVLAAKDQLMTYESIFLEKAQQKIAQHIDALTAFADSISRLDVYTSHALLAKEYKFVQAKLNQSWFLHIVGWRHPVIERFFPHDQQFIPNDLIIGKSTPDSSFLHIITGPNMGGKSTYLRQNALIVLMAHCGLFVPAQEAEIGIVDALFARVGSGDIIAKNQSTFMTEMIEVANILNNATDQSFIIFDELGRGTATYDGLALTRSILEYLATEMKSKTLIATHYHELIQLEEDYSWVKNFSVSVYETDKEVVFMKKIVPGGASKSYGLDVAKLAGISSLIIERAKQHLAQLETKIEKNEVQSSGDNTGSFSFASLHVSDPRYEKVKHILQGYDINDITPLQALQLLAKVKDELK